ASTLRFELEGDLVSVERAGQAHLAAAPAIASPSESGGAAARDLGAIQPEIEGHLLWLGPLPAGDGRLPLAGDGVAAALLLRLTLGRLLLLLGRRAGLVLLLPLLEILLVLAPLLEVLLALIERRLVALGEREHIPIGRGKEDSTQCIHQHLV